MSLIARVGGNINPGNQLWLVHKPRAFYDCNKLEFKLII